MGRIPTVFDASAASPGPIPPDSYGDESSSSHDATKAIGRLCSGANRQSIVLACWSQGAGGAGDLGKLPLQYDEYSRHAAGPSRPTAAIWVPVVACLLVPDGRCNSLRTLLDAGCTN